MSRKNHPENAINQDDKTVASLPSSGDAIIKSFKDKRLASRMIAMGILPGSKVHIVMIAPLKGGFYVTIDGNKMALRFDEAANIIVS